MILISDLELACLCYQGMCCFDKYRDIFLSDIPNGAVIVIPNHQIAAEIIQSQCDEIRQILE